MPSLDKGKCSSSGKESSPINISWRTDKDDKGTEKFNERCEITNSAKQNGGKEWWKRINPEFFNQNGGKDWPKGSPSGPYGEPQRKDMDAFPKTSLRNEDAKKNQISKLGVHCKKKNSSSRQIDACAPIGGVDTEVEMVDSLKSNGIRDRDGKVSGENCYVTISSNQNGIPLASSEPVPFEPNNKNIEEVQNTPASEALQNALTLLYRRRHEVYSQLCSMEDELILYEGNIERIRDGGEVGLALQCIESITNVHNSVSSKSENQAQDHTFQPGDHSESKQKRQMRLSDTFLSSKSENQAQDKAFQPDEDHCVSQQKRQMRLSVTLLSKSENQAQDKDFQPGEDHCDSQQKEQIRLSNTFLPRNSEQLMANAILKETEEENFPPHFTILAPFVDEVASNVPDAIVRDYIEQGDALVEDVSFSEAVPSYSCSMPTVADQVPLERSNCVVQHFQQEVWDRLTPIEQLPFEMSNSVDQQFQQEVRDRLTAMERLPFEMSNCVDQQFQQVRDRLTAIEQNLEILDVKFTSLGQRFTDTIDGFQQNLNHVQLYCKEEFQHFDAKFTSLGQRFTDTIDGLQQNLNHVELCCKEEFQHFGTKFNTVIGMLESLINVQQPCPEFKQSGQSEQLGGFKQAGDTGAGPSYTPSSLIYSFVSQFNTEVGPEGAFVYKGRGHCAKKKSKILRSSYTNPDRREQHALDTFNILREINPSKELSFQSWYQSAKDT
ncbi:uncharacterized protein Fot_50461 [Forsythia ovata]|uniref:Uncharacterized protein n=1 Tax=Forsythia ovata TaxID=205694 RepID=A0ABD1PY77_9LAMI